jgi:sterol desaturase/sphingolipid hydroxylase (fatty acid hydroxylase superfamily)
MLHILAFTFYFTYVCEYVNRPSPSTLVELLPAIACVYWSSALAHMIMDRTPWFARWNVHPHSHARRPLSEFSMLPSVVVNQCILGGSFWFVDSLNMWHASPSPSPSPSPSQTAWSAFVNQRALRTLVGVCAYGLAFHIVFHIGHVALHRIPALRRTHKQHHTTLANQAISSMYMHPIDAIVEIVLPTILPILLLDLTPASALAGTSLVALVGNITHGGYHIPYVADPTSHIGHHLIPTSKFEHIDSSPPK